MVCNADTYLDSDLRRSCSLVGVDGRTTRVVPSLPSVSITTIADRMQATIAMNERVSLGVNKGNTAIRAAPAKRTSSRMERGRRLDPGSSVQRWRVPTMAKLNRITATLMWKNQRVDVSTWLVGITLWRTALVQMMAAVSGKCHRLKAMLENQCRLRACM